MVNYIVSGCPRSGTSLTMNIISKSGMSIATDNKRKSDYNNKKGYFEVDKIVNKLKENPKIIFNYDNQVIKIIHYGMQYLPKGDYKIIYIERDLDEVMLSMEKMMGESDPNREETKKIFADFAEKIKKTMRGREDINFIIINHKDLMINPEPVIEKIIKFFNINSSKKKDMLSVIDKSLYRNRKN